MRGRHKTIAVVADAWHLRSLVRAALENKRTRVIELPSLHELDAASRDRRVDLVILAEDSVPDESAPCNRRAQPLAVLADVPVILLTAGSPPDSNALPGFLQPDRTLHTHFSPFELLHVVYALIGY